MLQKSLNSPRHLLYHPMLQVQNHPSSKRFENRAGSGYRVYFGGLATRKKIEPNAASSASSVKPKR